MGVNSVNTGGIYMKVAVTAKGKEIEDEVDPRFGRCPYFLIVDPDTMEFEALENQSAMAMGGAGPQASQAIFQMGVEVVITGNVGPNAFQALNAAGIKVMTGASGTVKDVVEKYKSGSLAEVGTATVGAHAGMGQGQGMGGGRGMGGRRR